MGEYIPSAPVNEEARKRNGNLPGMGGVFNLVNLHLYHYAGNNPVKFLDPDGRFPSIANLYNGIVLSQIERGVLLPVIAVGDFLGQTGNYIANLFTGKAKFDLSFSIGNTTLNVIHGLVEFNKKSVEMQFQQIGDETVSYLMDAAGSPITITSEGLTISVNVVDVKIKKNKDNTATVTVSVDREIPYTDISAGVSIAFTASTENGPAGTVQNRNSTTLNALTDRARSLEPDRLFKEGM